MDFRDGKELILTELDLVLSAIDEKQINQFVELITSSRRIFVVGVGRVKLSLLAFVKRLNHLGIDATYVGAIDEPAIGKSDLLIVGSGSGETAIPVAISKIAKKKEANIVHIGSNVSSTVSRNADLLVRIPCKTKLALPDEIDSSQPMSSLFEQALLLLLDAVALVIIEKRNIDMKELWHTHANLE